MAIQVSIDERARQFLSKKGNLLTVSSLSIENCCVPIHEVSIQYKIPDYPSMFNKIMSGNISIFVDKKLEFKNQKIKISHAGFGLFQTLQVDGLVRF